MATSSSTKLQQIIDDLLFKFDIKTINPIFRDCIKIPKNKQESRKFVSKPIQCDEILEIDQQLTDIVNGYINKAKRRYSRKNYIPFSTIPKEIYHWCLLYVHDSFPKIIRDIYNNNIQTQIGAVRELRILLHAAVDASGQDTVNHFIEIGIIPRIIQLLPYNQYPELQHECLWSLANVTCAAEAVASSLFASANVRIFFQTWVSALRRLAER